MQINTVREAPGFAVARHIWYLAENKREKIAFPKYPLLREM